MATPDVIPRWLETFPGLTSLESEHLETLKAKVRFVRLDAGDVAYRQGWPCPNYVMCLEGGTRSYKTSASGREILIYRVLAGQTCVLTTQCLLAGGTFPAESVAEADTLLAAVPAATFHELMAASPAFRRFVLDDFGQLLSSLMALIDEVAFSSLNERLARRLIAEANADGVVAKTHQQLAADLGSVREVISRQLSEWERSGFVRTSRGRIEIVDKSALASFRSAGAA